MLNDTEINALIDYLASLDRDDQPADGQGEHPAADMVKGLLSGQLVYDHDTPFPGPARLVPAALPLAEVDPLAWLTDPMILV